MKIEPLPVDVRCYLRSGVAVTSVTQCIEELVLNSLDAGATCVAVRVDLSCFKVQVVDNGSGVPCDQLDVLGNRFYTSKCHALADLDNLCHFGYRGEALASIRDSCGILEITTRSGPSNKTYCKIFQNGKSLKVAESTIVRPSVGTTMTIHELFNNFPVRQKSMNKNFEMERIKETFEGIALVRSGISFTLRNDSTGQVVLSTRKCSSINSTFGQLYGTAKADMLADVKGAKQVFKVQGYIGREGHPRKNLQFVYVNGRLVKKSKIHKLLNKLLLSLHALKSKPRMSSETPQIPFNKQSVFMSPPKFSEAYPVYILEVKCPVSEYDITFEPAKTMVEFKDWDTLLACIEEVTKSFLSKESIAVNTEETESGGSETAEKTESVQNVPVISTDTMKDVLVSKTVRRATKLESTGIMFETPARRNTFKSKTSDTCTEKQSEEENTFKTPEGMNIKVSKDAIGLGNRELGIETDKDVDAADVENVSELNNTSTSDYSKSTLDHATSTSDHATSTSDDSTVKEINKAKIHCFCKGNDVNKISKVLNLKKQSTVENSDCSKHPTGNISQCSLSRYRQSIGKFTGRQTRTINIDESLKKLNTILPSTSKQNSMTLFSSLQKFRRKIETGAATRETKNILDSNFCEVGLGTKNHLENTKAQNLEPEKRFSGFSLFENCTKGIFEDDENYKNRNIAKENEVLDKFMRVNSMTHKACTESSLRDKDGRKCICTLLENEQNPTKRDLYEASISSQENVQHFKFSPCCESSDNADDFQDKQKFDVKEKRSAENEVCFDMGNCHFKTTEENRSILQNKVRGIQKCDSPSKTDCSNIADQYCQNVQCHKVYEDGMEFGDECDMKSIRYNRKRGSHELEISHECQKQVKYTARPLNFAELETDIKYKQDACDTKGLCNKLCCDEINLCHEKWSKDDNNMHSCDKVVDVTNEEMEIDSYKEAGFEKQLGLEIVNEENICPFTYESKMNEMTVSDIKNESILKESDILIGSSQGFIPRQSPEYKDSTQGFIPTMSPESNEGDKTSGMNAEEAHSMTPESLGFSPKLQTENIWNTPDSTGFVANKDIELAHSIDTASTVDDIGNEIFGMNSVNISAQGIEQNYTVYPDFISENEEHNSEDKNEIYECKVMLSSVDKTVLDDKVSESVTLTQLLKTPAQEISFERKDSSEESAEAETVTQNSGPGRKGFSFADIFSQTPLCSMDTEAVTSDVTRDFGDITKITDNGNSSKCKKGMREKVGNRCRNCSEKGENLDGVVFMNGEKLESDDGRKVEDKSDEILWTDSSWDVSESSFDLRSKITQDKTLLSDDGEQNVNGCQEEIENCEQIVNGCQGEMENGKSSIGDRDKTGSLNLHDMNTLDSLDVWYQRLDAGVSVASEILQSKKPSDVVRRLHACRFSKDSLKSVKVLGQLDKKFIVCLINTEEQNTDIDDTMLVLVDQHAAHERIRLEILTQEAFLHGDKGGKLAPFAVDPAYSMTFGENEVRTILSFQDGFLKLGINLRQDTPTTVLISSIPASLVDKEKNNKIYWSTIQVLIREHIAVFMSTQVPYGVLPQTIHKVLCSLACHGAIKFGDRLSADECVRLVKDLSRCDLPFQCAHGRPSVMPMFHMDKLQSLSLSERQAKPNLWKLKQALKLKQKMQH